MKLLVGVVALLLAQGLTGCSQSGSAVPSAPTALPQAPAPVASSGWGPGWSLTSASLSGRVSEVTPTGQAPVQDVEIYCDTCGEMGHTSVSTDSDGSYRFTGVWQYLGRPTTLLVSKPGYLLVEPSGTLLDGRSYKEVVVAGDTRLDLLLERR